MRWYGGSGPPNRSEIFGELAAGARAAWPKDTGGPRLSKVLILVSSTEGPNTYCILPYRALPYSCTLLPPLVLPKRRHVLDPVIEAYLDNSMTPLTISLCSPLLSQAAMASMTGRTS